MKPLRTDIPLCVDLDGTLIRSDMLYESFIYVLKQKPWLVFLLPVWLLKGRLYLKQKLSQLSAGGDFSKWIPLQRDFLDFLKQQKQAGVTLVLVSASDQNLVDEIARRVDIFDESVGSQNVNLKGSRKLQFLQEKYPDGFGYAGNSKVDVPVWQGAEYSIGVNCSEATVQLASSQGIEFERQFGSKPDDFTAIIRVLRPHHAAKNVLLFLPLLLTSQAVYSLNNWVLALTGFVVLCMVTYSTYIINDLMDLQDDRQHEEKKSRPLAAGDLGIPVGCALAIVLLITGFVSAFVLSWNFALIMALYLVITLSYSFWLKSKFLLDVIVLGILFTLRILAGIFLINVETSFWLLGFALTFFTALSLVKRLAEIKSHATSGSAKLPGRGYSTHHASMVFTLGIALTVVSMLILGVYLMEVPISKGHFSHPKVLWLVLPLIFAWKLRTWHLAWSNRLNQDPVAFALRDPLSLMIGTVCLAALSLAL